MSKALKVLKNAFKAAINPFFCKWGGSEERNKLSDISLRYKAVTANLVDNFVYKYAIDIFDCASSMHETKLNLWAHFCF